MELQFVQKENAPDMPKILYKYRTWNKDEHKRLLTHNEIYYASPDELDELTECIYQRDYESVTDSLIWDYCLQRAMNEVNAGLIKVPFLLNRANYLFKNHDFYNLEHRIKSEKEFRTILNEELSIFCSSETAVNKRLWDTFADFRSGYCVAIDFSEIYSNDELFGTCGRVEYYPEKNPPKLSPLSATSNERVLKMMKIMYSLPDKFKDEQEFRFTKMKMLNKRLKIKPEWIKEVIIGSETSVNCEKEIVKIVKEKYPNASIKRLFVEPTFDIMSIIDYKFNGNC